MWVLIILNTVSGAMISIPEYPTREACQTKGQQIIDTMAEYNVKVSWICSDIPKA